MPTPSCAVVARPLLDRIAGGALRERPFALRFWDGSELPATTATGDAPTVVAADARALGYLLHEPNQLGLSRGWVSGALRVDGELERVLALRGSLAAADLSLRERAQVARAAVRVVGPGVLREPAPPARERRLRGSRHSRRRDRDAVRHHYDVDERFYACVLGPSMVYSCAYFADPGDTLEAAQERKLEVICRKLRLRPGDRLLDVGCGWGSLVVHAARHHGVEAVGVTLSEPQAQAARRRAEAAGVDERCEFRVADYREVDDGPYDAIASVGMYEHVGRAQLDVYTATAQRLLARGGLFLNHGIVRLGPPPPDDKRFIDRYVFPDGELLPIAALVESLERAELELRDVESLREHYALTLRRWNANLEGAGDEAVAIAGDEVARTWELYMLACAMAFETGEISVVQALASHRGDRHRLPLDRRRLLAALQTSAA